MWAEGTKVKALFKAEAEYGLQLVERPEPEPGDGDVKIHVLRTGICGTDLRIEAWDGGAASLVNAPIIPGHEFSGEVVAVGQGVRDVRVGDLVSGAAHVVCGACRSCRAGRRHLCIRTQSVGVNRDGAFAEFVVLPETGVWVHRSPVDPDLAAIFDPVGNAVHTALTFPLAGGDVLITGGGPIGLMAAAVAKHLGARFALITDVSEPRLQLAREMGVDVAVNLRDSAVSDERRRLGMMQGFDVALEMSGSVAAMPEIISNLAPGGHIAMFGLPSRPREIEVDWATVIIDAISIQGISGRQSFETWPETSHLLDAGLQLDPVITDRLSAADWMEAFAIARHGRGGKVVLDWTTT